MQAKIIDVLAVIDVDTIVDRYGENTDADHPTPVRDADLVRIVTPVANAGDGPPECPQIKVSASDVIRWRETTSALNTDRSVVCYSVEAEHITDPTLLVAQVEVPVADPDNPTKPGFQNMFTHLWDSLANETGQITYGLRFLVIDSDGRTLGYYSWHPFSHIRSGRSEAE